MKAINEMLKRNKRSGRKLW